MPTYTLYPAASSGGATSDTRLLRSVTSESLATIRAGAGTNIAVSEVFDAIAQLQNDASGSGNFQALSRGLFSFPTDTITDTDTIDSATFSLYGNSRGSSSGTSPICLVGATPASPGSPATSDYSNVGSTEFATRIAFASWSDSGYNDFALNGSGLSNISKTAVSSFAIRIGWDLDNNLSGWTSSASNGQCYYLVQMADSNGSGTTQDPKLVVNTTAGGGTDYEQDLSDSITPSEAIVLKPVKILSESVTPADAISNRPVKNLSDSVTTSDAIVNKPVKNLSDSITASEQISNRPVKILSDSVTMSDNFSGLILIRKELSDSITLSDAIVTTVVKNISDTATLTEVVTKTVRKVLGDTISLSDEITTTLGNPNTLTKSLSDSIETSMCLRIYLNGAPIGWYQAGASTAWYDENEQSYYIDGKCLG